jgi:hypothetical protein
MSTYCKEAADGMQEMGKTSEGRNSMNEAESVKKYRSFLTALR